MVRFFVSCLLFTSLLSCGVCQEKEISRQESLRGAITPERNWWNLLHYDLSIQVMPESRSIRGNNKITYEATKPGDRLQIDLQPPLKIDRVIQDGDELKFDREGNVYWVQLSRKLKAGEKATVEIDYSGKPVESKNPPWSGGFSWQKDKRGEHFIATSCQGIGASIWWPCKDHGYDEPDHGMSIRATVPEKLTAVSNGRLVKTDHQPRSKTRTFHWQVKNPINNYCVNLNIGNYVNFSEKYKGEGGELDLDYWVLKHHREAATRQFVEAPRVLEAFEYWFGKYPFYEDSYKLVQVPYLGMEHQSSVTYGNGFRNGYRGTDLSGTGVGLKFDFIIVHESGHEWFGNNISMKDVADMWIHESFTNYSENLFVEYFFTQKEAEDYVIGCRKRVSNNRPIIGTYNANRSGSSDMYYKGGNMLHTIRHVIDNDIKWRKILRGLNRDFWHQTVTTAQIEKYISQKSGMNLGPVFDQYLRATSIPEFVYQVDGNSVKYRYEKANKDFSMPVKLIVNGKVRRLTPTTKWKSFETEKAVSSLLVDRNFYVSQRQIK